MQGFIRIADLVIIAIGTDDRVDVAPGSTCWTKENLELSGDY